MLRFTNVLRLVARSSARTLSVVSRGSQGCGEANFKGITKNHCVVPEIKHFRNYSISAVADECWSCKHVLVEDVVTLFCPQCSVLQRAPTDLVSIVIYLGHLVILTFYPLFRIISRSLGSLLNTTLSQLT